MARFILKIVMVTVFVTGAVPLAHSQGIQQRIDEFSIIDWTRRMIRSTGVSAALAQAHDRRARIEALESAKARAASNLLKAVGKLVLSTKSTVQQRIKNNSTETIKLRDFVQRFTIVDTRSLSDMSVEVDVELPISDGLTSLFLPKIRGNGKFRLDDIPRSPLSLLPWPECRVVPPGVKLVIPSAGLLAYNGKPYTGLIINAAELPGNPAVFPRILDENGLEVYSLRYANKKIAISTGVVGYHQKMPTAERDKRAGSVPLIICGLKTSGKLRTDIIVSNSDAVLIHAAAKSNNFLKTCSVIFVLSGKK